MTKTLTLIVTYTCTAACTECCFGCTPKTEGRLSWEQISETIREAKSSFPGLQIVVFTGGECFLLKEDLFAAIALCTSLGLKSRCVTNGSWGKTRARAQETASKLVTAGVGEINISTGKDHAEFVPIASVLNAAQALVEANIWTLITIEQDTETSSYRTLLNEHPVIKQLMTKPQLFRLQCNSWMPFTHEAEKRPVQQKMASVYEPCSQIFQNVVVTPHGMLSACCGLTLEHIPEMKLGRLSSGSIRSQYESQLDDFLKIWIHTEGPGTIIKELIGEDVATQALENVNHICQACAYLHLHPVLRERLTETWTDHADRVLKRFATSYVTQSLRSMNAPLPAETA